MRKLMAGFVVVATSVVFAQLILADDDHARRKDGNRKTSDRRSGGNRTTDDRRGAEARHPQAGNHDRDRYADRNRDRDRDRGRDQDRYRDHNRDRYRGDYQQRDRHWDHDYIWRGNRNRWSFGFYTGFRPYWYPWYRTHYVCVPGYWAYDDQEDDEYWVDGYCYDPYIRNPYRFFYH